MRFVEGKHRSAIGSFAEVQGWRWPRGSPWPGAPVALSHLGAAEGSKKNGSKRNQDNWGLETKQNTHTQAEAKAYTSEKEFWKKLSLHFYFRPENLWGRAMKKNGFFKKMIKEVVGIFGKERFSFWKTKKKYVFLTAIFKPKIVWHEMFVKFLLNWKRDSKLLQFCSFICLFSK